jgi:hypothetical protein
MIQSDLDNRFAFHPATIANNRGEAHASVREQCREMATFINALVPEGREKSLAITHLEEVMMWANAAIARSE